MKSLKEPYTLHNGIEIPSVGFGTWQAPNGPETVAAVKAALAVGYRHIDTAAGYGNEESVGIAVKESGLDRKDVFITSKLANQDHGYQATLQAFEKTMKNLGMDYLDLYLIHWPVPVNNKHDWQEANAGTWKAFEELYEAGRIRSLGISNFMPHHIEELQKTAKVEPMVNQIRLCPGDTQDKAVDYSRAHNILLEAYSPLGTGQIFTVPELAEIAAKNNRTIAQVSLRWSLQRGYLPLPKSMTPSRIAENFAIFDFELSDADMAIINGLYDVCGLSADPDNISW